MYSEPDLLAYGVDLNAGLRRMDQNRALYLHFLCEFPGDDSLDRIEEALTRGDAQEAYALTHAYKGVAAQLGLARLSAQCAALCGMLEDNPSEDALRRAQEQLSCVRRAHRQALRGIALLS